MIERVSIPFVGGAYQGRSTNINAQQCENLYPVIDKEGGKVTALMNTPGQAVWITPFATGEVRGLHEVGDHLYAVIGNAVHKISPGLAHAQLAGTLTRSSKRVIMADNGTQLMIVEPGVDAFIIDTTGFPETVTQITDADFPANPVYCTYQDGYFIVVPQDSQRFYLSALNDGTSWDALDYASKEAYPDYLLVAISTGRELWLIGNKSYEVWYNSGASDFPFARISGAVNNIGLYENASLSVVLHQNVIYFYDNERQVRRSNGFQVDVISTPQIEYQLGAIMEYVGDSPAWAYSQEGHSFYMLTMRKLKSLDAPTPEAGITLCYDITTGLWHKRKHAEIDYYNCFCHCYFWGKNIVGDYRNGTLYYLDLGTYEDYRTTKFYKTPSGSLTPTGAVSHA